MSDGFGASGQIGHRIPVTGRKSSQEELTARTALATSIEFDLETWRPFNTLPRVTALVGRSGEIERIVRVASISRSDNSNAILPICALHGMAGVGKTALALAAAHSVSASYPDGQLYLNLHGFTGGRPPLSAQDALGGLLRQIGVPPGMIPIDADQRAAMWRDKLWRRRVIVVLDNAVSAEQVEPLLPGSPTCAAIVTSRRYLDGIENSDNVAIANLSGNDAVELLRRLLGNEHGQHSAAALQRVAKACQYLPLALNIAARYIVRRPHLVVDDLADQLESSLNHRMRIIDRGSAISNVLTPSYLLMGPKAQEVLQVMAILPGVSATIGMVSVACSLGLGESEDVLDELVENHLVEPPVLQKYHLHDLVRDHLRYGMTETLGPIDRAERLGKLVDYYQRYVATAVQLAYSSMKEHGNLSGDTQLLEDAPRARAWMEREREGLLATILAASKQGMHDAVVELAALAAKDLLVRGYFRDAITIHSLAGRALRSEGGERFALSKENLGNAYWEVGRFDDALKCFSAALDIYLRVGGDLKSARVLDRIGFTYERMGDYYAAEQALGRSLRYAEDAGDQSGAAGALNSLGAVHWRQAKYDDALRFFRRALLIRRAIEDQMGEVRTLNNIGFTYQRQGRFRRALALLRRAWLLSQTLGDMTVQATILSNIGYTLAEMSSFDCGIEFSRQGLATARKTGSAYEEARALDAIGLNCSGAGNTQGAAEAWKLAKGIFEALRVCLRRRL